MRKLRRDAANFPIPSSGTMANRTKIGTPEERLEKVKALVRQNSETLGIEPPEVRISDDPSEIFNAFVRRDDGNPVIYFGQGILRMGTDGVLSSYVGHEVMHVKNNDAAKTARAIKIAKRTSRIVNYGILIGAFPLWEYVKTVAEGVSNNIWEHGAIVAAVAEVVWLLTHTATSFGVARTRKNTELSADFGSAELAGYGASVERIEYDREWEHIGDHGRNFLSRALYDTHPTNKKRLKEITKYAKRSGMTG